MKSPHVARLSGLRLAACALGMGLLVACAGDPPTDQLAVASVAVNAAETAGAVQYAPLEMRTARDKLEQARQANINKDYEDAKRLAQQAEWDARLAERKAQTAKAERAAEEAQKSIQLLRNEALQGKR